MHTPTTTLPALRAQIEQALDALSGTWRSPSEGRIMLVFGPAESRGAVTRSLRTRPLPDTDFVRLVPDGLFLSLASHVQPMGFTFDPYSSKESFVKLAAAYAAAGRRLVLLCDDAHKASRNDLGYVCRGVNATVNGAYDGKPGVLLILMGKEGDLHRAIHDAWPDSEMGTQSHYLG